MIAGPAVRVGPSRARARRAASTSASSASAIGSSTRPSVPTCRHAASGGSAVRAACGVRPARRRCPRCRSGSAARTAVVELGERQRRRVVGADVRVEAHAVARPAGRRGGRRSGRVESRPRYATGRPRRPSARAVLNGPPPGCADERAVRPPARDRSAPHPRPRSDARGNGTVPQRERGSARRAARRRAGDLDRRRRAARRLSRAAAGGAGGVRHVGPPRHVARRLLHRGARRRHQRGGVPLPRRAGDRRAALPRPRHARALDARLPARSSRCSRRTASTSSSTPATA